MSNDNNKQSVEINSNLFVKIIYPDVLYDVQNELTKAGIHFIDLNTGLIVTGNINIDTLGMVSKKSFKKHKKPKNNSGHFLIPPGEEKIYDIEATINIYEPQDEYQPVIITIQIIDENDLDFWQKICIKIGQKYLYPTPSGRILTEVIFHLVPLTLPGKKDPKSAINAMLGNIQKYRTNAKSSLDMLPGYVYPSLENYDLEDDIDP